MNDEIKSIGFRNTNLVRQVSDTTFEVLVNNKKEAGKWIEKIQTDIVQFLINRLKNSFISMVIKVAEESELQRTLSPEERYKSMVDQNPALEKLRKNLQLEID